LARRCGRYAARTRSFRLSGWYIDTERPDPSTVIHFQVYVAETNQDLLREIATAVSTPGDSRYGKHLTPNEITQLTAPREEDMISVKEWLSTEERVAFTVRRGRVVDVVAPLDAAERLLHTTFEVVTTDTHSGHRAATIKLPPGASAVFGVHGPRAPPARPSAAPAKQPTVLPQDVRNLYRVNGTGSHSQTNRQAVVQFFGQTMVESDLVQFFARYVSTPYVKGVDDKVSKFVGVPGAGIGGGGESTLDIQWIMGMAPAVLTEFWLFNGGAVYDFCHALQNFTETALAETDGPNVFSISYGVQHPVEGCCQGCTRAEVDAVEDGLAKLAAKGVTVIFASGDSGSGYAEVTNWTLTPAWPASSPWVTTVGSTSFKGAKIGMEEVAAQSFGSGGGFSTGFDQPAYQSDAVKHFFDVAPHASPWPPAGSFPPGGRATPDLSLIGGKFQIVQNGKIPPPLSGTSGSAPSFAALVSLLNEVRLSNGGAPMGFLNPFLFQHADAFTDITSGTNALGDFQHPGPTKYGFNCTPGWDPVTGLGTPIFPKLLAGAMATTVRA
jgi:tripeptidyl-peptidase-1